MMRRTKNRSYKNSIRYLFYNSPQPQGFIYTSPFGAWFAMPQNICAWAVNSAAALQYDYMR